jgi:hypothetical protein
MTHFDRCVIAKDSNFGLDHGSFFDVWHQSLVHYLHQDALFERQDV